MEACEGGHLAVVELLLKRGEAVDVRGKVCVIKIKLTPSHAKKPGEVLVVEKY